jgi:2,4-diketo-3-deoxy-L-fuconate hydrolase
MRVGAPGAELPVVLSPDGQYRDLRPVTADIDGAFWATGGPERVLAALEAGELPVLDIGGQRIGAPVARPGVVLCIGMNYAAHAAETGAAPPQHPVVFYKAPNTVVGPGRQARYLDSPGQALEHVAGYAISNDVSERAFGHQRQQVRQA